MVWETSTWLKRPLIDLFSPQTQICTSFTFWQTNPSQMFVQFQFSSNYLAIHVT